MSFPLIQTSSGGFDTATNTVVPLPSGIQAGDLILVFFQVYNSGASTSISTPAGWTLINEVNSASRLYLSAFAKVAVGGETSVTITTNASRDVAYIAVRITGYKSLSDIFSSILSSTSNSTTISYNSLTPAPGIDDYMWIAIGTSSAGSTSAPSGYTQIQNYSPLFASYKNLNANSETPGNSSSGNNNRKCSITLAIAPSLVTSNSSFFQLF